MSFEWTDETTGTLRKLWMDGFSFSLIAAKLGTTRNAAIGKARRVGLRTKSDPLEHSPNWDKPKKPKVRKEYEFASPPPIVSGEIELPQDYRPPHPVSFKQLTSEHCHWPLWSSGESSGLYCGDPVVDSYPYCAHHRHMRQRG